MMCLVVICVGERGPGMFSLAPVYHSLSSSAAVLSGGAFSVILASLSCGILAWPCIW